MYLCTWNLKIYKYQSTKIQQGTRYRNRCDST